MRVGRRVREVLGVAVTLCALGSATDLPNAQADPSMPSPGPSLIDQLVTSTPVLWAASSNTVGAGGRTGDVGMVCQNLRTRCR
jgi:hypothetical protein